MKTCFVIQPFDGGKFDKRYIDVFNPAIEDAKFKAYRVDHDPKAIIPIDEILRGIKEADIYLADISLDNPNVWFELGLTIAYGKSVILLCSEERITKFPFDVQHRHIVKYRTESSSDFDKLKIQISEKIMAVTVREEKLQAIATTSPLADVAGLSNYELMILAVMAGELDSFEGALSSLSIKQKLQKNGYTDLAANIGIRKLCRKEMIINTICYDTFGNEYSGYSVTKKGWDWIEENEDKFMLVAPPLQDNNDDVPF